MNNRIGARSILITLLLVGLVIGNARAQSGIPEQAAISGFTSYPQSYSLSCESRSAADWAAYWGVSIYEADFLNNLPRSDNPNKGFVGYANDPWGFIPPNSYGVHAQPVADLLVQYGLQANARFGMTWDELRSEIAAGRPVIVWVISEMWNGRPISYTASDGETLIVAHFEHTMVVTGYTATTITLADAYAGYQKTYSLSAFLNSWSVLGNMAVTGQAPPPEPELPETVSVAEGETLAGIAARYDLSWDQVAALNQLTFPYQVAPGQVIAIRGAQGASLQLPSENEDAWWAAHYTFTGPPPPNRQLFLALILQPDPGAVQESQETVETYIVQRGDYLTAIARQFGLNWLDLSVLNDIPYPYNVYPGQVLRLK